MKNSHICSCVSCTATIRLIYEKGISVKKVINQFFSWEKLLSGILQGYDFDPQYAI